MSRFRVWAPNAGRVELASEGHRIPMRREARGWWSAEGPPTNDYAFVLDDGQPLPDPRSPWQPHGVHGASRPVDHSRFAWTDEFWQQRPLASGLLYEMHVGTLSPEGTF